MFETLANLFRNARSKTTAEQEPYQNSPTAAAPESAKIQWERLDASQLDLTSSRVRQIERHLACSAQAEFAAVIKELNASQQKAKEN